VKYLEDHNRAGEVETFKKNINGVMKNLLGKFKDLQFYQGKPRVTLSIRIFVILYRYGVDAKETDFLFLYFSNIHSKPKNTVFKIKYFYGTGDNRLESHEREMVGKDLN